MKFPKNIVATDFSTYYFALLCFFAGYAAITVFSLGRATYDDREGPDFNPVSRMPDGRLGLSESAIGWIGFATLGFGAAALIGLGLLWRHWQLM